jgi:hypothetical protein
VDKRGQNGFPEYPARQIFGGLGPIKPGIFQLIEFWQMAGIVIA